MPVLNPMNKKSFFLSIAAGLVTLATWELILKPKLAALVQSRQDSI